MSTQKKWIHWCELKHIILILGLNLDRQFHIQCKPDIRELSGPENKSLISEFGLFCLGNTGSNLGPEKITLISGSLISGLPSTITIIPRAPDIW